MNQHFKGARCSFLGEKDLVLSEQTKQSNSQFKLFIFVYKWRTLPPF